MYAVTTSEMRQLDQLAIEKYKIPAAILMENAGRGAFEILKSMVPDLKDKKVLVVAGKGNNGGDAHVVARYLQRITKNVRVLSIDHCVGAQFIASLTDAEIVVDGLFGTGLSRPVSGMAKSIIEQINQSRKWVLSLDIPSGLSANTGKPLGVAVKADVTVTMGLPKIGLLEPRASDYVGRLEVVDIGIPKQAIDTLCLKTHWITVTDIKSLFSPRPRESHKGSNGHLLLIGGSATKPGAILLAGRAALRTGAGLVTVALPDKAFRKLPSGPPLKKGGIGGFLELMYEPLPSTRQGTFSKSGWKRLTKLLSEKDAVAIGPGMGVNGETKALVRRLMSGQGAMNCAPTMPVIIDADALNCLAPVGARLIAPGLRNVVLTPHPGEMSRLTGKSTKQIQENRIGVAKEFAQRYGVYLVLKGYRSVVATPEGEIFINSTGNPGMATAGMGDVLTGVIASLLAQGMKTKEAVIAGVYLHGRAGDRVAERLGDRGLLAGDLIEEIPLTLKELLA